MTVEEFWPTLIQNCVNKATLEGFKHEKLVYIKPQHVHWVQV